MSRPVEQETPKRLSTEIMTRASLSPNPFLKDNPYNYSRVVQLTRKKCDLLVGSEVWATRGQMFPNIKICPQKDLQLVLDTRLVIEGSSSEAVDNCVEILGDVLEQLSIQGKEIASVVPMKTSLYCKTAMFWIHSGCKLDNIELYRKELKQIAERLKITIYQADIDLHNMKEFLVPFDLDSQFAHASQLRYIKVDGEEWIITGMARNISYTELELAAGVLIGESPIRSRTS